MSKPSLFQQVEAVTVGPADLLPSPRHWNAGLFRHAGKLWLCYRYHLKVDQGRCATAICQIHPKTFRPIGKSQEIPLKRPRGDEHCEDARLFHFLGEPYISYTEMTGYKPGVDFKCVMKYARLKLVGGKWKVLETMQPKYGRNNGTSKEKNWIFFQQGGRLFCIYAGSPEHVVLRIEGEKVVDEFKTPGPRWDWGIVRGGTPPIPRADGTMLSVFHSSMPSEMPPAYVRYYAAAYTFAGTAPFAPLKVSTRPVMIASEEDGHANDPRFPDGWKPFVVFPCGLIEQAGKLVVSMGVNDWRIAIASLTDDDLHLGRADGSDIKPRFFRRENGTMPIRIFDQSRQTKWLEWQVLRPGRGGQVGTGYMNLNDPREAQEVAESPHVAEITSEDFHRAMVSGGRR